MKWLNIKIVFFIATLTILPFTLLGESGYEKRIEGYKTGWDKLIPRFTKIQYAGSMGLLSFGTGWDYGKSKQWETDIYIGFVPKYSTDKTKVTFTFKQNYMPWKLRFKKKFMIEPLACGMYLNTVLGGDFWPSQPDKYPSGYYKFSTKIRINAYFGQRITCDISSKHRIFAKSITFFYEISTNDLYLISAVNNSYLKPKDYLGLSLGVKLQMF